MRSFFSRSFLAACALGLLSACSSSYGGQAPELSRSEQQLLSSFQVKVTPEKREVRAGEPFRVLIQAKNMGPENLEFLSLTCDKQINWWVNNSSLERLQTTDEQSLCQQNRPLAVNLQPGDSFEEVAVVQFQPLTPVGVQELKFGFAPWQSARQLEERSLRTLPVETATAMTIWSPQLRFEVAGPGHRTIVR